MQLVLQRPPELKLTCSSDALALTGQSEMGHTGEAMRHTGGTEQLRVAANPVRGGSCGKTNSKSGSAQVCR